MSTEPKKPSSDLERWKEAGTPVSVKILGDDGKETRGQVYVRTFPPRERIFRALKFLGLGWGAAVVAVFIPILHFILVPLFLIAGPAIAFWAYGQTSVVLGGQGTCPHCGASLPLERSADRWPLDDLCSRCRNRVKIEKMG